MKDILGYGICLNSGAYLRRAYLRRAYLRYNRTQNDANMRLDLRRKYARIFANVCT